METALLISVGSTGTGHSPLPGIWRTPHINTGAARTIEDRSTLAAAFDKLNAFFQRAGGPTPPKLSDAERRVLVAYAEGNMTAQRSSKPIDPKDAFGRLQALYVAGALATLDKTRPATKFENAELSETYTTQRRYIRNVTRTLTNA